MLQLIYILQIFNILLVCINSEHHYHVESILSPIEITKIIKQNGGTIITELQFTGKRSYHAKFDDALPLCSRRENLLWWQLRGRHAQKSAPVRLERHPAIRLTYQDQLRVEKRTKYDCVETPFFSTLRANITVELSRKNTESRQPPTEFDREVLQMIKRVRSITNINDVGAPYAKQYINDGTGVSPIIGYDINVYPAYALGLTGIGAKVLILDDAVDMDHCDIMANFNAEISTNLVDPVGGSKAPVPPEAIISDKLGHGTQCAGLVAGVANNTICSHGVAYNASVGGVRLLGPVVTDSLEADAFSYRSDIVDIYCASWGPTDNGMTMDQPRKNTLQKLKDGWKNGRNGLGSIFVFASGNGGDDKYDDNCGADGFVGRPEVISVGALDEVGNKAKYAESCASLRCSVPVGGTENHGDPLPSTNPNSECLINFPGTSAAAPLAAGCFSLAIQANPKLTPRDLEHLIVWSTRLPNAKDQRWYVNAAGILHSINVGFGLLDCTRMALLAQTWNKVGPLCLVNADSGSNKDENWISRQASIPGDSQFIKVEGEKDALKILNPIIKNETDYLVTLQPGFTSMVRRTVTKVAGSLYDKSTGGDCDLEVLEKVVVQVQWEQLCRGSTNIWLTSPAGTRTKLLSARVKDVYNGPTDMTFTSVAQWGESITGTWFVEFEMIKRCSNPVVERLSQTVRGAVYYVNLQFQGTTSKQSGYELNQKTVERFLTPVGHAARKERKGTLLDAEKLQQTYTVQREMALTFTNEALQKKFGSS